MASAETETLAPRSAVPGRGVRVLAIPGSLRRGSRNLALLAAAAEAAPRGCAVELLPQRQLAALPGFDPSAAAADAADAAVGRLRERVAAADALLLATPEYNGSLPGCLKDAIDWAAAPGRSGPLRGKPAAVIGADRSAIGCDWAQAETRKVLEMAGARVLAARLAIDRSPEAFAADGTLAGGEHRRALRAVLEELLREGGSPG